MDRGVDAVGGGVSQISTKDLPGGVPEDQLKDAKSHHVGHLSSAKKSVES
jgi:protein-tyrosine phosphatase